MIIKFVTIEIVRKILQAEPSFPWKIVKKGNNKKKNNHKKKKFYSAKIQLSNVYIYTCIIC